MQFNEFIKEREKVRKEFLNSNFDDLCCLCTKEWFCSKDKEDKNKCFFPVKELVSEEFCDAI